MWQLWNATTHSRYHDFSPVFLNDGPAGWGILLSSLQAKEKACPRLASEGQGQGQGQGPGQGAGGSNSSTGGDRSGEGAGGGPANPWEAQAHECVEWRRRRARRNRRLSAQVYGGAIAPYSGQGPGEMNGESGEDEDADEGDGDHDDPGIAAYYPDIMDADVAPFL